MGFHWLAEVGWAVTDPFPSVPTRVDILDGRVFRLCGGCAIRVNKIANQSEWAFVFATELMYCGLRWFEMKSSNLQLKSSMELHRPPSFSGGFCLPLSL